MKNLKILHLATDDKFLDHAYTVFEKAYSGCNDVLVFSKTKTDSLKYVKLKEKSVVYGKSSFNKKPNKTSSTYEKYDLVVFHSFGDLLYPEIYSIPENIPAVWLGWGYDYYDLIANSESLLLTETQKLSVKSKRKIIRKKVSDSLRFVLNIIGMHKQRYKAIEKLTLFSPVLPNEYELVRKSRNWHKFPKIALWNYGTIEDHFVKGFEDEQVDGDAIMIGNSASFTSNHKEILILLSQAGFQDRKIVTPLSYGNKKYGQMISCMGYQFFGENFEPLMEFMPVKNYVASIKKCGYVIMNHKRQQAIGNIVIMLFLGARVFLREENPAYEFLREMGVTVSSVQQLEKNITLLEKPLLEEERKINKKLVSDYWSRERGVARTKALVEKALKLESRNSDNVRQEGSVV